MLSEKIEDLIRRDSKSFTEYKGRVKNLVKTCQKTPEFVTNKIINYKKTPNSLPFIKQLENILNN